MPSSPPALTEAAGSRRPGWDLGAQASLLGEPRTHFVGSSATFLYFAWELLEKDGLGEQSVGTEQALSSFPGDGGGERGTSLTCLSHLPGCTPVSGADA